MACHPNQREIDELYAGLCLLTASGVYRLSDTWTDGAPHRRARARALHPDTPAAPELLRILLALPVLVPTPCPTRYATARSAPSATPSSPPTADSASTPTSTTC